MLQYIGQYPVQFRSPKFKVQSPHSVTQLLC